MRSSCRDVAIEEKRAGDGRGDDRGARRNGKSPGDQGSHASHDTGKRLGLFLCWAVVFADIGTSVYYVPGILYGQVGHLAGFFGALTLEDLGVDPRRRTDGRQHPLRHL
ncbi:MAG TPA: hypothetical protein VFY89_07630 [Ktedonobacterales bacterium]